jgi:hypothetical protein
MKGLDFINMLIKKYPTNWIFGKHCADVTDNKGVLLASFWTYNGGFCFDTYGNPKMNYGFGLIERHFCYRRVMQHKNDLAFLLLSMSGGEEKGGK